MWSVQKTSQGQDLVWSQPELGVGSSALKGTANLKNVNIATEPGQVMAAFARTAQQQNPLTAQTLTPDGTTLFNGPDSLKAGTWIKVTASTVSSITAVTNPSTIAIDYLAVGGGGGGGNADNLTAAGGGGGGEVATGSDTLAVGSYSITIGAGGNGGELTGNVGGNGESTIIAGVVTVVGGGGGGASQTNVNGVTGASGGGAGSGTATAGTGGTATAGNAGGDGYYDADAALRTGGGGGGAGTAGGDGASALGGNGGDGLASSITGTSILYGAGGGGGSTENTPGNGGDGGGGNGGLGLGTLPEAGEANTGSGGGGGATDDTNDQDGADGGSGIAVISYPTGSALCIGGSVSYTATNTVHTFTENDVLQVLWVNPGGLYYVSYSDDSGKFKLSSTFDPYGTDVITHGTTGSITFETLATPGKAVDKATEKYQTTTGTEYRYYVLDDNGRVWHYDTQVYETTLAANGIGVTWILADPTDYTVAKPKGIDILNGWLMAITSRRVLCKPTVNLGNLFSFMFGGWLTNPFDTHPNYAIKSSQGTLVYTDGNFIGEVFPTTSLVTSVANLQSYASYTASTTTGTISTLIGGSIPSHVDGTRLPVVFFAEQGGDIPTAIIQNKVYFIEYDFVLGTFEVYDAIFGGSTVDIETGATGTQYFNSFYPIGNDAGANGTNPTLQFSPQRLNLPFYETAQKLVEVDNNILIGCKSNIIYPWNQVDAVPSNVINLPESDVQTMLNVNNTAYVFAGDKGNIYLVNTTASSLVLTIPDYIAGIPGTANSYIEPTFLWGDAIFCRGRVYCSILDQTATKAGNAGGVWSFIPSENVDPQQEVGSAPRLENQNSYGSYNGYCPVLIVDQEQEGKSPKYWSFWQDSIDSDTPNYGIDYSSNNPVTEYIIETDLAPTGTMLTQQTFKQIEYKLAVPPLAGDIVTLYYRQNPTGPWVALTEKREQTDGNVYSGYYIVNFQRTEWLQIQAVVSTSGDASTSTFAPITQIRVR